MCKLQIGMNSKNRNYETGERGEGDKRNKGDKQHEREDKAHAMFQTTYDRKWLASTDLDT